MGLTRAAITRPVFIIMVFAALIVLGLQSLTLMPVELFPRIEIPYASVLTIYPGAGPREIETLISKPLEEAVNTINGVKSVQSSSQEGISVVVIEFVVGTDLDVGANEVRSRLDAARVRLPREAETPVLYKASLSAIPVLVYGVSGARPAAEVRQITEDHIKDRLAKVPGVASVSVTGGRRREIQVDVDKTRLQAYGLSIVQVAQALAGENLSLPSGNIREGRTEYAVRTVGEFASVDDILAVRLPTPLGPPILLRDVARINDAFADTTEMSRLDRRESVGLVIQKQADANTVRVVEGVKQELRRLGPILPRDLTIKPAYDQSVFLEESLADVRLALILGAILAVAVVYLFLHNLRSTFIVSLAIPTSMVAAFTPMYFAGFSLNMMTMMALALTTGILVDDSIVVLENIHRHLHQGELPRDAALNGRSEIGLAAIAITLTDVVVFVPIAFMRGIVGQFFREFGLTVAMVTLFSLLVSFTLTPMLASRWFARRRRQDDERRGRTGRLFERFDAFYGRLDLRYRDVLAWALGHRWTVVAIGIAAFLVVIPAAGVLGFEFMPSIDQGQFTATIETPAGTNLETTNQAVAQVETLLSQQKEVDAMFTRVGSQAGAVSFGFTSQGPNTANISVRLVDKRARRRSDREIMAALRRETTKIAAAKVRFELPSMGGQGAPVQIELLGDDFDALSRAAAQVAARVRQVRGTVDVDTSWQVGRPELQVHVDRLKASSLGLSTGLVAATLRAAVQGATDTKFRTGDNEYDIRVRFPESQRQAPEDVAGVLIAAPGGQPVFVKDVATVTLASGPTKIDRKDRQRMVTVEAGLAPGYFLGNVQREINKQIAGVPLADVSLRWGGEAEQLAESGGQLGGALLLSVVLVYILMAALFEGFLSPFIIMFSLPMALVGAILGLLVAGMTLSIVSMIGIIMLVGLVTKNAILLVDYTNTLRARGRDRRDAILEAGPTRLRPILMTTSAMIMGMLPTALGLGSGAEFRAPMAVAVIGGLIWSTLLTLVVIPVVYTLIDDLTRFAARGFRRAPVEARA
jgi:HAE1 family hydrophobic/amphiphilic exporter-1